MARTTEAAVVAIIETDVTIGLTPFIEVANLLVTKVCTDSGNSVEDMEMIERWLSAHFYAIRDPRASEERAGPVSERKKSKVDLGFDVTHYGQMAMRIDTAGQLAALNEMVKKGSRKTISVGWAGTPQDDISMEDIV